MQDLVNRILSIIKRQGFEIQSDANLKKPNSKKSVTAKDFFKDNFDELECSAQQFIDIINHYAKQVAPKEDSPANDQAYERLKELLSKCRFYYDKFKWHITEEEQSKLYYFRAHKDSQEFKFLTNDPNDNVFFNCFDIKGGELRHFISLVNEYNQGLESADKLSWKKIIKIMVDEVEQDDSFWMEEHPVTFTNNPLKPTFKFFDLAGLEERGDAYYQQYKTRPPTPAWDCFFARIRDQSMVPVVKAFIAGLFIDYNKTKQVLYIYGNGNDGKSQITEALQTFMGKRVTYNLPPNMVANQFTLYGAYGKRMFIGEEMQSPNIIKNGLLHAVTGGGIHRIEKKGDDAFSAKIYGCGLVTSNYCPNIADVKNQIARLMYIEMNTAREEDINTSGLPWSDAIKSTSEIEGVIYEGLKYFRKLNPTGAAFKMPETYMQTLEELFDEKSNHINEFIRDVFEYDEKSFIKDNLTKAFTQFCEYSYFTEDDRDVPRDYYDNKISKDIFEKLYLKYPNICKDRKNVNGTRHRVIKGLKIKESNGSLLEILSIS